MTICWWPEAQVGKRLSRACSQLVRRILAFRQMRWETPSQTRRHWPSQTMVRSLSRVPESAAHRIMRLQANGELDLLFGNAGSTLIDLPSEFATSPVVHDMTVQPDGRVLAAGSDRAEQQGVTERPFVVRLLGMGDDDVPGVLGVSQSSSESIREGDTEAVVRVRRTGGDSGSVSVAFQTIAHNVSSATGGEDYGEVSGRLTWGDGDTTEQEIRVPIVTNDPVEEIEYFRVMLSDTQGGAGLGARNALVRIGADGYPAGQFEIWQSHRVSEGQSAQLSVFRTYYETGAVSVTLTPVAGTATAGDDFAAEPVTLSWPDGDRSQKFVEFAIYDDTTQEGIESFTVELSDPTGGAVVDPQTSVAIITIAASDQGGGGGGGGGSTGLMSLLLLAAARLCRTARIAGRLTARN